MWTRAAWVASVVVLGLWESAASPAAAQQMGGQPMMRGKMSQMQDMMQRMRSIRDRAHQMAMGDAAHDSGPMAPQRKRMQRMGVAMAAMADQMQSMMAQAQTLTRDSAMIRAPGMLQAMAELQQRMDSMTVQMERMDRLVERMHRDLGPPGTVPNAPNICCRSLSVTP